jgi:arginyl-tRNA synthetase
MSLITYFETLVWPVLKELYGEVEYAQIQIQKTRKEFSGDITLVVFPLLKLSRKSPEQTALEVGTACAANLYEVENFTVVKGFLNLQLKDAFLMQMFADVVENEHFGFTSCAKDARPLLIEFSSPNTNKPLHLGHIRNNLLGDSIARILKASGEKVVKVNLVNDRGIHICKSMLAWQLFGEGETPQSSGLKGDHLVGKYYVVFDKKNKEQIQERIQGGMDAEHAAQATPLMMQAQEMLRQWEAGEAGVRELWNRMNGWVYEGFEKTYHRLGIEFDKTYYESQTYLLGRQMVLEAREKGLLHGKEDGSVWADLTDQGLDEKLLLRADGTSVYMTQDLGTAKQRYEEYLPAKMIYVVGNEQNYHFEVLKKVLHKLRYHWAESLQHLSYGMVELPEGKMKSREGTVVDADDLMQDIHEAARAITLELGKTEADDGQAGNLFEMIGLGAIKYFILKVDPRKNMLFNPEESIDFTGNTGPFIQYTHARIRSLAIKAGKLESTAVLPTVSIKPLPKERELMLSLFAFPAIVREAADELSPALIANYAFDLAKLYNQFYQEIPVTKEENAELRQFRIQLSVCCADILKAAMSLLGIQMPERM